MAAFYVNSFALYGPPLELVDHQHERIHQHNTFLGAMTRRNPNQKTYPNHPNVDISDATIYYLIELEIPGIKDPDSVALNWTNSRSLVVAGSTFRSWQPKISIDPELAMDSNKAKGTENGVSSDAKALKDHQEAPSDGNSDWAPSLVVGERKIGYFRREFHFPVDVNVGEVEARLEAGLLRIKVPVKSHMDLKGFGKVRVQGMD
jgi:HSP20 family molecular chaperone IbpA